MSKPTLLSTPGLAHQLGVDVRTIRRLVREDGLPAHRVGHAFRYDPDKVAEWLRDRNVQQDDPASAYRAAIKRLVDDAPELSAEQADRITSILRGGQ